ncbi:MAG: CinA family protein, partial [Bacteroidales bacterium]|nr:CinA family protein [Bacteroidales bacterium]
SYANNVKINVLGVPSKTIELNGAVSSETAAAMALGVKKVTGSDFSVATTGIAGPTGATPGKPVGLVWVGVATPEKVITRSFNYKNDRATNIERFAASALYFLLSEIIKYTIVKNTKC